jgi:hypothetical protein
LRKGKESLANAIVAIGTAITAKIRRSYLRSLLQETEATSDMVRFCGRGQSVERDVGPRDYSYTLVCVIVHMR